MATSEAREGRTGVNVKTYTTSECIAILERDPEARFEAPETDVDCERKMQTCNYGPSFSGPVTYVKSRQCGWIPGVSVFRSDWVRTDKVDS